MINDSVILYACVYNHGFRHKTFLVTGTLTISSTLTLKLLWQNLVHRML